MPVQRFDAEAALRIERQYATPTIVEQRRRTLEALRLAPDETVIDIGCGPGYLAAEMAEQIGSGGHVIALDTSEPMLAVTRRRCERLPWVTIRNANALALPLADASADAVTAVQVLLLLDAPERLIAEAARVLRSGGRLVVVDTDWGSLIRRTHYPELGERLRQIWMRRYANAQVARMIPGMLRDAGLRLEIANAIPLVELTCGEDSFSGNQLNELARHVVGADGVTAAEADAFVTDQRALDASGRYFYSLNRYLFLARKP